VIPQSRPNVTFVLFQVLVNNHLHWPSNFDRLIQIRQAQSPSFIDAHRFSAKWRGSQ
jgi:hypothetical protein